MCAVFSASFACNNTFHQRAYIRAFQLIRNHLTLTRPSRLFFANPVVFAHSSMYRVVVVCVVAGTIQRCCRRTSVKICTADGNRDSMQLSYEITRAPVDGGDTKKSARRGGEGGSRKEKLLYVNTREAHLKIAYFVRAPARARAIFLRGQSEIRKTAMRVSFEKPCTHAHTHVSLSCNTQRIDAFQRGRRARAAR